MERHPYHLTILQRSPRRQNIRSNYAQRQSKLEHQRWRQLRKVANQYAQIIYDLHQLSQDDLGPLRDSLIALLRLYSDGPKPIRTQICVCLASLAVQFIAWKDVLPAIGAAVQTSKNGGEAILDFLRILPEEVIQGRKINMTVCSA